MKATGCDSDDSYAGRSHTVVVMIGAIEPCWQALNKEGQATIELSHATMLSARTNRIGPVPLDI
jgi:hypothetical protein